ncbi:MAG: fumarate hydratase [Deltaproteobacteria bacterium]|jgi:fumarate hydratase subunit alpha|nr:fumarate hydratase [Deltaproteobacteria bacterium]
MRSVETYKIGELIALLIIESATKLPPKVMEDLKRAFSQEPSAQGRRVLSILLDNTKIAEKEKLPLCQDTGLPQIQLEIGQDISLVGEPLYQEVKKAVKRAFIEANLRRSGCHPLTRVNLKDNIPISLETKIAPGDRVLVRTLSKGGGCDNRSKLINLPPTASLEEIQANIIDTVLSAGPDACPPFYVGICIGGTFESAPRYARQALWELVWDNNFSSEENEIKAFLLESFNASGIGPMCVGGRVTVLDVGIKIVPTHIASLPIAINLCCHSFRPGRGLL